MCRVDANVWGALLHQLGPSLGILALIAFGGYKGLTWLGKRFFDADSGIVTKVAEKHIGMMDEVTSSQKDLHQAQRALMAQFESMDSKTSHTGGKRDEAIEDVLRVLQKVAAQTDELWKLHDQRDGDGVPVWYLTQGMRTAIEQGIMVMKATTQEMAETAQRLEKHVKGRVTG